MASSWTITFLGVAALLFVPSAHCQLNCSTNSSETGVTPRPCSSVSTSNISNATIVEPTTTTLSQEVKVTTMATMPTMTRLTSTSSSTDAPSSTSSPTPPESSPATTATSSPDGGMMTTSSIPPSHSSTTTTVVSTSILIPSKSSNGRPKMDSSPTKDPEQSSSSPQVIRPSATNEDSSPRETPPPSTTAAGALDSATIIGIALGGAASLIVFAMVVLIASVCCFCRKKEKSGSHSFVGSQGVTGDARMYETPSEVLSGSNGVDNPVAYATSNTLRYVEHTDVAKITGSDVLTGSLREDVRPHSITLPKIAEPQEYETVRSSNSHNPPVTDTPMYEEPRDSMIRYRQSQEVEELAQQPYEVPVRTSSYEGQSPTLSASMNGTEPLNRFSLCHRTVSESQASPLINSTPSPGFRDIPSPYAEPVTTSTKNVPDDDHHYFVLEKGRVEQQPSNDDDEPFYFELENHRQATTEPGHEENASENLYAEVKKKDEDKDETDHSNLQVNGSSDVTGERHHEEERHHKGEIPSGPNENEGKTTRSNSQGNGNDATEERDQELEASSGPNKQEKTTEQSNLENDGSDVADKRRHEGEVSAGPEEHLYFVIEKN